MPARCARFTLLMAMLAAVASMAVAQDPPVAPDGPTRLQLIEARDLPLGDLLRMLTVETGVNITPSAAAAQIPVSVYLRDVTLQDVLEALADAYRLTWRRESDGRLRITTREEAQAELQPLPPTPLPSLVVTVTQLNGQARLDVSATDTTVGELLRRIGDAGATNVVMSPDAAAARASVQLHSVTVVEAIDAVCAAASVRYERSPDSGIVRVFSAGAAGREPVVRATGDGEDLRLTIQVQHANLRDILPRIAAASGLNIVPSPSAGDTAVTLYVQDVRPMDALDALARAHSLWLRRDDTTGIVRVHTVAEYRRDVAEFREDRTRVFTLTFGNALEVAAQVGSLYGDRIVMAIGGDEDAEVVSDLQRRLQRFDMFDGRSQGFGSGGSGGGSGGGAGSIGTRNTPTQRNSRTDARTATPNRVIAPQRVQDLTADEIDALEAGEGADPSVVARLLTRYRSNAFLTVSQKQNRILVRTGDEQLLRQLDDLIRQLDVPTPLLLLEVKVLSIDLADNFNSAFDWQSASGEFGGQFSSGDIAAASGSSLAPGGSGQIGGALLAQFVGDAFRARLQLLESRNRVTALATPVLLTANREVSRLFIGSELPINRSFVGPQTVVGDNGGTTTTPGTTAIEFRPVGTTLLITPDISSDRTVTLRILQESSSIKSNGARVLVPTSTGFTEQFVDTVQTRTISGTMVAKDQHTVAIGGLIEEEILQTRESVPILGEIPLIGLLFQRNVKRKTRTELIVLIRPVVLNTPAEAEAAGRAMMDELSVHPAAPYGRGTLRTFDRDDPPSSGERTRQLAGKFHYHSFGPAEYGDDQE
ncbi:MAG: type II secretion system protein GspD [Planctomycetota bacterium]